MATGNIDPTRLDVLRSIAARQKGALDHARDALQVDISQASKINKQILDAQRAQPNSSRSVAIGQLDQERRAIEARIADQELKIEILTDRSAAARTLFKRCETYLQGK